MRAPHRAEATIDMTARALHRSSSVGHALSKMRRMMLDPIYIFHVVNIGPAIRPSMSMPPMIRMIRYPARAAHRAAGMRHFRLDSIHALAIR